MTDSSLSDPARVVADIEDGIVPPGVAIGSTHQERSSAPRYRRIALIVATALLMQNLDATVLTTALPTLARDFAVSAPSLSLALTSYLLALAIFIPASGYAADRFGARGVFMSAIALFVAGSLACGLSINLPMLVGARFVQGIGGAMMIPVGRLVLLRTVDKADMLSAISWLTMPALIGPIVGPPLGGAIVTWLDWRWIFWINLPIGVAGIMLVRRFVPSVAPGRPAAFDGLGFALSGAGLAGLLFGLQWIGSSGRMPLALALLAIGALASAAYVAHARRAASLILDLTLLRIPTFSLSVIGGTLIRVTQGALPFLMPMMMQLAFGMSAAASGAVTMALALGAFAMKIAAKPLLARFGFRTVLVVTGLLAPAAYAVTGLFRPGVAGPTIAATLFACGFLVSLQFTAYNTIAYADVEQDRMSRATAFYATFQQLSLSMGVCIAASALALAMRWHGHDRPLAGDFSIAIATVTAVSLAAVFWNLRFARNAGAEISGHLPR